MNVPRVKDIVNMKLTTTKSLYLYEILNIEGVDDFDIIQDPYLPAKPVAALVDTITKIRKNGGGKVHLCAADRADIYVTINVTGKQSRQEHILDAVIPDPEGVTLDFADPLAILELKNTISDNRYASGLLRTVLSEYKFVIGSHDIHLIDPSFGNVSLPRPDQKTIAICTPCYRRTELLNLYVTYMTSYYIPYLQMKGFNAVLVLTGSQIEKEAVVRSLKSDYVFIWHDNNLGAKKNIMLTFAQKIQADYVTYIDSDDFVHPDTTLQLVQIAEDNGYWAAIEPFIFFDSDQKNYGLFEGYDPNHSLYKWGMGSGRVFTTNAIQQLGKDPFAKVNKSMDYYIREKLNEIPIPADARMLTLEACTYVPIGLKSSENIWAYDRYKLRLLENFVSWLPKQILEKFMTIPHDSEPALEDEASNA